MTSLVQIVNPEKSKLPYTKDTYHYVRRKTREVMVGNVGVGGNNPIRIQSMTTTTTKDVDATYAQTITLVEAGCEIVRVTTPTVKDAQALGALKRRLRANGIDVPLVADIHFSPQAAMEAALHADKVRINPGNFADSKNFSIREYSDDQYTLELARIEQQFAPLVLRCKERGVSMRIGTNHGSLSDRIMNRYGDTPEGMVASALEFLDICEKYQYYDVIFSMKASNPKVMIQTYRLLVARLDADGRNYPMHLGVTEAGNAEDGRIKSAIGIGSLLEDGIGDTIRVSLTEDPEHEVPVAYALAERYTPRHAAPATRSEQASETQQLPDARDPYHYVARTGRQVQMGPVTVAGLETPRVIARAQAEDGHEAWQVIEPVGSAGLRPDIVAVALAGDADLDTLRSVHEAIALRQLPIAVLADIAPGYTPDWAAVKELAQGLRVHDQAAIAEAARQRMPLWLQVATTTETWQADVERLLAMMQTAEEAGNRNLVLGISGNTARAMLSANRWAATRLKQLGKNYPLHLAVSGVDHPETNETLIETSISQGALLTDGIGNSIELDGQAAHAARIKLAFDILQNSGARSSKTEFIACPSCGRTLFDLQTTTERIKAKTGHLVGVKIAIMGCIVNGLGELADADFGYMGGAPGKINLFVGKECVEKNIPTAEADERLIDLIKSHGKWVDPA